jgi:hypothetical protein
MDRALDKHVRTSLHAHLKRETVVDDVVINELDLQRKDARIDVAVVTHVLHGYEIKSEADKVDRLPRQVEMYGKVMDYLNIVVDSSHLKAALRLVPVYWGVYIWTRELGVQKLRDSKLNIDTDKRALAQMLWREAAVQLLIEQGVTGRDLTKPKAMLWESIAAVCSHQKIHAAVVNQLRTRWKPTAKRAVA